VWSLLSGDGQASRLRAADVFPWGILWPATIRGTRIAIHENDPTSAKMNQSLLALFVAAALLTVSSSVAQTPDPNQEAKLLALIKEVQTQQAQLAENQAKIEEKLAVVSESVRTARIYAKRGK
jgi:hypothetical protein